MAWTTFLSEFFKDRPIPESVTETRSAERQGTERRDYDMKSAELQRLFVWGARSDEGVVVNDSTILSSTPFYSAVRYVSEGIAMLDRKVRRLEGYQYVDDFEHPISFFFKRRPNPYMTWFDLICAWILNAMLGNGYLLINWDKHTGRPFTIEHVPSRYVTCEYDFNGYLWYRISGEMNGRQVTKLVPHTDILHLKGLSIDGHKGEKTSLIHRTVHGSSLSADSYTESVFEKGAFPSIAVKTDESLDATEAAQMESNLMHRIGGAKKAGKPLVLDNGQDVQFLQWSPLDVALEAVKHLSAEQVAQITKVPRDLLALDTSGTYGAAVQRSKDFFIHCLQPWVERIQEEFNTKLFTDIEINLGAYIFEFDDSLYLSVSPAEQTEMFAKAIKSSQMTPNEARQAQGRDSMDGGDQLYGDINFVPLSAVSEIALAKYLSSAGEKVLQGGGEIGFDTSSITEQNTDNESTTQSAR